MKFRTKFLSLAAASALAATAFVMTGCGGGDDSSSGGGATGTGTATAGGTSTELNGTFAKGLWAGIPYELQRRVDNSTMSGMTTESGGEFSYSAGDNVTFRIGLGLTATFRDLNLTSGSTIFAEDADVIKQGNDTFTGDKKELIKKIGAIYQQMGVLENSTDVNASKVQAIAEKLDEIYKDNPSYYALTNGNQVAGFSAVIGNLYKNLIDKLMEVGISLTAKQQNATDLALGYVSNVSDITTQRNKVINDVAEHRTLKDAPSTGDLRYARIYAARPKSKNDTLMATIVFGDTPTKGRWINGTIIQNVTSSTGAVERRMVFTTPKYEEGSEIAYQNATATSGEFQNLTAGRYMFTLTPIMDNGVTPSPTTLSGNFNITVGSTKYEFKQNKTDFNSTTVTNGGIFKVGSRYGFYNITDIGKGTYAVVLMNNTCAKDANNAPVVRGVQPSDIVPTPSFNISAGTNITTNKTIAFKTGANKASRSFVGYYWDKALDLLNLKKDKTDISGAKKATIKIDIEK